jgi:hypothetical protein
MGATAQGYLILKLLVFKRFYPGGERQQPPFRNRHFQHEGALANASMVFTSPDMSDLIRVHMRAFAVENPK